MKTVLTLAALVLTAVTGSAVELKLKWNPGKRYVFEQETNSKATVTLPGQGEMKTDSKMLQTVYNDVSKHEKGTRVGTKFESMRMKTSMNGAVAMEFDSKDPAKSGGLIGEMLKPLVDANFASIYDKDGKIAEFEGLEDFQGAGQLGLGKDELKSMASQAAEFLPGKDVKVGESWNAEINLPLGQLGQDAVLNYTLKLDAVEERDGKKIARISMTGKMKHDLEDGGEKVLSIEAKNVTGMILFDLALGQPIETRTTIDMEMAIPAGVPQAEGAPGKMPVSATSVQRLLRVEDLPKAAPEPAKAGKTE